MRAQAASVRWQAVGLLGAAVASAAILAGHAPLGQKHNIILLAALLSAGVAVYVIWHVPPAWSVSAGVFLTLFGSNWSALGLPRSAAPDRFVLGVTVLAVLLKS